MSRPLPVDAPRDPLPISAALESSAALARLGERLAQSRACFAAVLPLVPPALAGELSPGPLDDAGWSILCTNAAVAAKVRHLVPRLQQRLVDLGLAAPAPAAIRVKVLPPGPP